MIFGEKSSNISEPLAIVWTQVDPTKDIVLVAKMIAMLGGPFIVLKNPELFSSVVSQYCQIHLLNPVFPVDEIEIKIFLQIFRPFSCSFQPSLDLNFWEQFAF